MKEKQNHVYVTLLRRNKEKLEELEILQRRRLPFPDGKNKKILFTNHSDEDSIILLIGYLPAQDTEQIFSYTELEEPYHFKPGNQFAVNVKASLVEQLYKKRNEDERFKDYS